MTRAQRIALAMRGFPVRSRFTIEALPAPQYDVYRSLGIQWTDNYHGQYAGYLTIPMRDGLLAVKPPRGCPCS